MPRGRKAPTTTNNNAESNSTRSLRSSRKRKNEEAQEPPVLVNTTISDQVVTNEVAPQTTSSAPLMPGDVEEDVVGVNDNKDKVATTNKSKGQRGGRNKKRKVEDTSESVNNGLQKEGEKIDSQTNVSQEIQPRNQTDDSGENKTKGKGKNRENTSQVLPKSKERRSRAKKVPQEEDTLQKTNIIWDTPLSPDTFNQQEDNNADTENPNGKSRRSRKKRTRNSDEINIEQNGDIPAKDDDISITNSHNTRSAAKKLKRDNGGIKSINSAPPKEPHTDSKETDEVTAMPDESNSNQKGKTIAKDKGKSILKSNSKSSSNPKNSKQKKKKTREFEYLTTNPNSELTEIDMKEQKARLISLVPSVDKVPIIKNNSEESKEKMEIDEPMEIDEQFEFEYLMKYSDQNLNGTTEIPNASSSSAATASSSSQDIVTVYSDNLPAESAADIDASKIVKSNLTAENADIVTVDGTNLPIESSNLASSTIEDHPVDVASLGGAGSTTTNGGKRPKKKIRQYFFNDMQFYGCVKAFKEKLSWSHFDPKWVKRNQANQKRLRNTMDEDWKDLKFEAKWGHNLVSKSPMIAGDSASLSLRDLCQAAIIRAGDELHYRRAFHKASAIVEGVVKITEIKPDGTMYAVNQNKSHQSKTSAKRGSKPNNTTIIETPVIASSSSTPTTDNLTNETPIAITKITSLETKVLDDDGRVGKKQRPNGNAYKSFRVIRAGYDLGTIFALRSEYYEKTHR
ncbi:12137_t:CDS:2 [Ambispora leptoticha]|uniref:12137_t:CDS:1 n=1 Tax=Ambispora leptoticha TaxID=144679 RepID=A0A9N8ZW34_9GLOM|nr:12137_t:CDS:2 [Ambispora leptoticha]